MQTVVILGGGPAGCQCALWLKMLGHTPIIIEKTDRLGGLQALNPYENNGMVGTPLTGYAFAKQIEQHLKAMDISVLFHHEVTALKNTEDQWQLTVLNTTTFATKYLVIATGVKAKSGGFVETEKIIIGAGERIFNYDFQDKRVAILGGGDNAAENYTFVLNKRAKLCHVYARTVRARANLWQAVRAEDCYLSTYDVDPKTLTVTHDNITKSYDVLIVLYGWEANFPSAFSEYQTELLNKENFIITDEKCRTPLPGIYAIGEITNRTHPSVITAMADGVIAAKAISDALESGTSPIIEQAIFAGGCFWGVQHYLHQLKGVLKTEAGYLGGETTHPTSAQVARGNTGHCEAVRVTYDARQIDYETLTKYFFEIHNPLQAAPGFPRPPQYRTAIFYFDEQQKQIALKLISVLEKMGYAIATEVIPVTPFWCAAETDQQYYVKHGTDALCHRYEKRF